MSSVKPPPLYDAVVDETGVASMSWTQFFNAIYVGDTGRDWNPTFVGLGQTGTPTIAGRYYRISRNLVYLRVDIVPATNTTSTAGTTYIDNFPLAMRGSGPCFSMLPSGGLGGALGVADAASGRIYTPPWTNVAAPVIVVGIMEAQ
jgi:hypothetical protein